MTWEQSEGSGRRVAASPGIGDRRRAVWGCCRPGRPAAGGTGTAQARAQHVLYLIQLTELKLAVYRSVSA